MKKTMVISGFPGVGKSYLFNKNKNNKEGLVVLDSDSSKFSWIEVGVRHPDFPDNYMEHIKNNIGKADYIFVSSHDSVRRALEENEIEYSLVYPAIGLKDHYIERFKKRGSEEGFIKFIESNWNNFIDNIKKEAFPDKIELDESEFLSDVLNIIE